MGLGAKRAIDSIREVRNGSVFQAQKGFTFQKCTVHFWKVKRFGDSQNETKTRLAEASFGWGGHGEVQTCSDAALSVPTLTQSPCLADAMLGTARSERERQRYVFKMCSLKQ